ncbi:hypothetical protein LCGC14_0401490 [marine sediment metagenome]|uniref:Uncharacterized protein n=1 Tax=marine sediment metagenome TaxID=412755 RepID=A0A0F9VIK9_9ZZZZ
MRFTQWAESGGYVPFNLAPDFRMGHVNVYFFADAGGGDGGGGGGGGDGGDGGDGGGGGGGDGGGEPGGGDGGAGGGSGGTDLKFSQADLNRISKKERDKYNSEKQVLIDQLKDVEKQKGLSDEARANLQTQIRDAEESLMTAQEKSKAELGRAAKVHGEALDVEKSRADLNWDMYVSEKKRVAISAAASKHGAYRAEQLTAVVEPMTEIVPVKDSNDNIIGHDVIVKVTEKAEDGTTKEKALTVDEYVDAMRANEDHANLFVSTKQGGSGYRPGTSGTPIGDLSNMSATDKIRAGLKAGTNR